MQYDQQCWYWDIQSIWLQCDVCLLKSLLWIGDIYIIGDVFDSIQFCGVQLMFDDEMFLDSQCGFVFIICGVVYSNVKVIVFQYGYVIYEIFVLLGVFVISDFYFILQSGDLEVKVIESNGVVCIFIQFYFVVLYMLCEGCGKFSFSVGCYYFGGELVCLLEFLQGILFYGLMVGFIFYGGMQLVWDYQVWVLGLGCGFGEFGLLGGDVIQVVICMLLGKCYMGYLLCVQYQKNFVSLGIVFSFVSYCYLLSGYYDFVEVSVFESVQG